MFCTLGIVFTEMLQAQSRKVELLFCKVNMPYSFSKSPPMCFCVLKLNSRIVTKTTLAVWPPCTAWAECLLELEMEEWGIILTLFLAPEGSGSLIFFPTLRAVILLDDYWLECWREETLRHWSQNMEKTCLSEEWGKYYALFLHPLTHWALSVGSGHFRGNFFLQSTSWKS